MFPEASRVVIVMVVHLKALPPGTFAVECCAEGPVKDTTVMVAVCETGTPPTSADTVLSAAIEDETVPDATPLELVTPTGWVTVLPLPDMPITTGRPAMGFPALSRAVTVIADCSLPA